MALVTYDGRILASSDYDLNVKGIAHRGYSADAPENTLPAYKLAKKMGFKYVECDVAFTSDGVAVLLHDEIIDRTSNGSGSLSSLTYAQVRSYDFGSWKSSNYAGTLIPSFEEFILLCKNLALHPYIELKSTATYTEAQVQALVDTVKQYGMEGKVTWISFSSTYLGYVKDYDAYARIGFVVGTISSTSITTATGLKTGTNEVFIDANYANLTTALITLAVNADIPLEVWTVDTEAEITALDPYISGITSDSLIAGTVLYKANID